MPTTWVMTCAYSPSGSFVTCGGLDNKITMYKITADEDISKQKRVVANHTNYISCNKFIYSDQKVENCFFLLPFSILRNSSKFFFY